MVNKKVLIISLAVLLVLVILGWFIFVLSKTKCGGSAPNVCNDQCWEECEENRIFSCDASGGLCVIDPNNCPVDSPNSCNGQCWSCGLDEEFVCDESLGGICQKK
jgi:hypothetical protein